MSKPDISGCLTFHRTYAKLRFQLDEELGDFHGIDFDEFALLHALARAEDAPTQLALLADELGASRSATLRRLRPLEKIGLIACHGGMADRRIALRPAGLRLIETAHDTVAGIWARLSATGNLASWNVGNINSD